jgi:hypothetical protein
MTLLELEQNFSLKCPQTLKQLILANLLGDYQHSAISALVDFAEDFEPLSVEQISQELEALYSSQYFIRVDPQFRFLPFGASGGGDLYCLYLNHNPIDPPVVFLWHDNDRADYLANNLSDFLFAELLGAGCSVDTGDIAKKAITVYEPYLKPEAIVCLGEVYSRASQSYSVTEACSKRTTRVTGYLSLQECQQFIQKVNHFSKMGQDFFYALPEPVIIETEENKRRVGTLRLFVRADAPKALSAHLKELNWRQDKNTEVNTICYIRKNYVIFGIPSFDTLDGTIGPKLRQLATQLPELKIQFTQEDGLVFEIA